MDRIVPRTLLFDRFVLDLTRGCLRAGDQEIELRPKALQVLCYLVENAGRLVAKEELHDTVWSDVAVSDDSIVQCIHELRIKLGDHDHRLIRTVSRRGYLLDAVVSEGAPQPLPVGSTAAASDEPQRKLAPRPPRTFPIAGLRAWHAIVAAVVLGGIWLAVDRLASPISDIGPGHVQPAESTIAGSLPPVFKDCEDCPEMVALPAGEFTMGSPASEVGHSEVEGPPRQVVIPNRIAIGKFDVTVDQFSTFVAETGSAVADLCRVIGGVDRTGALWRDTQASFRHPGFDTGGSHPVVCVSWHEAQAYATWLQRRTGKPYRLPAEAEWEYAARAGTTTRYSFGDDETMLCAYARFADLGSQFTWRDACRSELPGLGTIPVGSLKPNPWGLFDMHGNAWQWVQDCWTARASMIPTDGSAFAPARACEEGVIRGGSFAAPSHRVRSATRLPAPMAVHNYNIGFRVALDQ